MTIMLKPETVALVKKSNELAAVVRDLEEQKKRGWDSYRTDAKREHELEDKLLAGDASVFEEWAERRRQTRRFMAGDDAVAASISKARGDYNKAHEAAMIALRADAGLVWNGWH